MKQIIIVLFIVMSTMLHANWKLVTKSDYTGAVYHVILKSEDSDDSFGFFCDSDKSLFWMSQPHSNIGDGMSMMVRVNQSGVYNTKTLYSISMNKLSVSVTKPSEFMVSQMLVGNYIRYKQVGVFDDTDMVKTSLNGFTDLFHQYERFCDELVK